MKSKITVISRFSVLTLIVASFSFAGLALAQESDPDVKKLAEDTAKMVQEHLDLAKQTQSKLQ